MYFAYNLPQGMPSYIEETHRSAFNQMLDGIRKRMELLETALELSGLSGEVFSLALSRVFNPEDDTPALDHMEPDDIASLAMMLGYGITAEPRIEWPNAVTVVDTAFVTRKEWETLRRLGIGGSDAAVILGISPYRSMQALYHDKRGTIFAVQEKPDPGKEYIFAYGHRMEDLVIEQFCRQAGCERIRETRMFRHKDYPFITANIDAIVRFPDGRLAVFEAKTTTSFNRDAWADHTCPPHYVPQCRQYMAVLNDPRIQQAYIGCIYGNLPSDFMSGTLTREQQAEQEQIEEEAFFWNTYVEAHNEPPKSGNAAKDMEIVQKKIGYADISTKSKTVSLSTELTASLNRYMDIHEQRQQAEKLVKSLKEQESACMLPVIEALGKNIKGEVRTDGKVFTITNSPIRRAQPDLEKLAVSYPEAFRNCVYTPEESYRRLTVKVKQAK